MSTFLLQLQSPEHIHKESTSFTIFLTPHGRRNRRHDSCRQSGLVLCNESCQARWASVWLQHGLALPPITHYPTRKVRASARRSLLATRLLAESYHLHFEQLEVGSAVRRLLYLTIPSIFMIASLALPGKRLVSDPRLSDCHAQTLYTITVQSQSYIWSQ